MSLSVSDSILIARANAKKAEDTSSLDTETEELGRSRRKRQHRQLFNIDENISESKKKSFVPKPPSFQKSFVENIKDKLDTTSKSSSSCAVNSQQNQTG